MRFELTEHFCSTVFKTVAINQTLPAFHVALGIGLEPITLWLTARCSTIELPKNKCNHLMCGRFEQPSSHCVRYSTVELTHDYCVVYTVRHPWHDKPVTAVYKCRMEDGTGFEPVVVLQQHFFSKETQ